MAVLRQKFRALAAKIQNIFRRKRPAPPASPQLTLPDDIITITPEDLLPAPLIDPPVHNIILDDVDQVKSSRPSSISWPS